MIWVFWVVMAIVVGMIADSKGRSGCGYALFGLLLWPVALVMILLESPNTEAMDQKALAAGGKKCPRCAEIVKDEAAVCRFCQHDFAAPPVQPLAVEVPK
jgi:hypothetical protein